jgi:hypothetical protein
MCCPFYQKIPHPMGRDRNGLVEEGDAKLFFLTTESSELDLTSTVISSTARDLL